MSHTYTYKFRDGTEMEIDLRERSYPNVPRWDRIHATLYDKAAELLNGTTRVYDVGCGSGYGTEILSLSGESVFGLDIDIAFPQKQYPALPFEKVDFAQVQSLTGYKPGSVVCVECIEHVEDDRTFAENLRRLVRAPGILFLTTPERTPKRVLPPYHVREYTEPELSSLLRGAGFQSIKRHRVSAFMESLVITAL